MKRKPSTSCFERSKKLMVTECINKVLHPDEVHLLQIEELVILKSHNNPLQKGIIGKYEH